MSKNILINASNLHNGGAVQVASSFINELAQLIKLSNKNYNYTILVSDEVKRNLNLQLLGHDFIDFKVVNTFGIRGIWSKFKSDFQGHDIIFTVFGPNYVPCDAKVSICGFAQPWIIYPKNPLYRSFNHFQKAVTLWKYKIQKFFYKKNDILVVELDHVKDKLEKLKIVEKDKVEIVNNCFSSLYRDNSLWKDIPNLNINRNILTLGFIGRAYPHKNLSILAQVKSILLEKYNFPVQILLSLSEEELSNVDLNVDGVIGTGPILPSQCPYFYNQVDAVIFPSLLECFSATPMEAMIMKKPLFASDLSFVKEICKNYAFYFDPLSPDDIAKVIYEKVSSGEIHEKIEAAHNYVTSLPTAHDRASRYIKIIEDSMVEVN